MLKTFTIDDIRSWEPCYDPAKHLPENWVGTVIDILQHNTIPAQDKLWVVLREKLIDAKMLRLFAVWCARQVEQIFTDERSKNALTVAKNFANGIASQDGLGAAWDAALAAARYASAASWEVAWAASAAALTAAQAVASDAAQAAWDASWDAALAAARDALAAAQDAVLAAQINQLIAMITEQQVNNA